MHVVSILPHRPYIVPMYRACFLGHCSSSNMLAHANPCIHIFLGLVWGAEAKMAALHIVGCGCRDRSLPSILKGRALSCRGESELQAAVKIGLWFQLCDH